MDSLFAEQLSQSIEMQISVIFRNADKGNGISVTALPVQQQRGSTVCGVMSIAFAYHAAARKNVAEITFDQCLMWQHLIACFEKESFSPFPTASNTNEIKKYVLKEFTILLHCHCNLPECYENNMIECDVCGKWFHYRCVQLKKAPKIMWKCSNY